MMVLGQISFGRWSLTSSTVVSDSAGIPPGLEMRLEFNKAKISDGGVPRVLPAGIQRRGI